MPLAFAYYVKIQTVCFQSSTGIVIPSPQETLNHFCFHNLNEIPLVLQDALVFNARYKMLSQNKQVVL